MPNPSQAKIYMISISSELGQKKHNIPCARIISSKGIEGDAHSETARPLSLLPYESFSKLSHPELKLNPGDFAENITTLGLNFSKIKIGSRLLLGNDIEIEITQIGKECHNKCAIYRKVGRCVMPEEGVFAKVIEGGPVNTGDQIKVV